VVTQADDDVLVDELAWRSGSAAAVPSDLRATRPSRVIMVSLVRARVKVMLHLTGSKKPVVSRRNAVPRGGRITSGWD
jgi:hypothetical protein